MAEYQYSALINSVGVKNQFFICKKVVYVPASDVFESQIQYNGDKIQSYAVQNRSAGRGGMLRFEEVLRTNESELLVDQLYRNTRNKLAILCTTTDGSFKGNIVLSVKPEWDKNSMQTIEFVVDGDNLVSKI
jgi:hypothetical protein